MTQSLFRIVARTACALALSILFTGALMTSPIESSADWNRYKKYKKPKVKAAQLLAALESIKEEVGFCNEQLAGLQTDIHGLRNEVAVLGQDIRPCTPERFLADECGDDQHPFNLVVTLCGNLGAEATVSGSFAIENHNSLEFGVGWPEVVHVNLDRQVQFPGIPGLGLLYPPGVWLGAPLPDVEAGASGRGGVEVSGCIEGVSIPIGQEIPRERVVALIEELDRGARDLQSSIIHSLTARNLTPQRVASAVDAVEAFQENRFVPSELGMTDPLQIFQTGPLREVAAALPIGSRMQTLLDDPSELIPDFGSDLIGSLDDMQGLCGLDLSDRPTVDRAIGPICDLLDRTPTFERFAASIELIGDLPEEVKSAVADLLPEIDPGATIPPSRSGDGRRICNALPFLPRCR